MTIAVQLSRIVEENQRSRVAITLPPEWAQRHEIVVVHHAKDMGAKVDIEPQRRIPTQDARLSECIYAVHDLIFCA
jgi:hypothetical protein